MKNDDPGKKPFPWRCAKCGEQAVYGATVDYSRTMHHDGKTYTVTVPGLKTPKCVKCGQVMLDAEAMETLDGVFMRQLNLLTPEQIQENRLKANLTQHELAVALGMDDAVLERLESGRLTQPRSLDDKMRQFFATRTVTTLAG
jgi:DNA-binding transcriptional regulator YiaG